MEDHIVIVGAGHAGGSLAGLLRENGHTGSITLLGNESNPPYMRPPLSKAWLKDEAEATDLYLRAPHFYEDQDISLVLNSDVKNIDLSSRQIFCTNQTAVSFDQLVIATGARARRLQLPGDGLAGVHYLRDMHDAQSLKESLKKTRHLIIVGGGFIGLEVAASARALNIDVTVLEQQPRLLSRVASTALSDYLTQVHQDQGVNIKVNANIEALLGDDHVNAVRLTNGEKLDADLVLIGVGSIPNVDLLQQAGLDCANGIAVDDLCRSVWPNIYAIGDVSARLLPGENQKRRLESVPSALEQARQLALHLCGKPTPTSATPWFWSDQYNSKVQIAGFIPTHTQTHVLKPSEQEKLTVLHLDGDQLVAAECVNAPADFMMARRAIAQGTKIDLEKLNNGALTLASVLIK